MLREKVYVCAACEQAFGSKWALGEHVKSCSVRANAELLRTLEALAWKQKQVERAVMSCYQLATSAFTAYHLARADEAQRFRTWFTAEYQQGLVALQVLSSGLHEVKPLFPRIKRMKREAGALLAQARELQATGSVLGRLIE